MFIAVEGLDGAGKTTAIKAIMEQVEKLGGHPIRHWEPGGTIVGEKFRSLAKEEDMCSASQMLLMSASRIEAHRTGMINTYHHEQDLFTDGVLGSKYPVLISDRYDGSTHIYQKFDERPALKEIYLKIAKNLQFKQPDLYIFMDVEFEESCKRRKIRVDADVDADKDQLEALMSTSDKFNKMRDDYRNFFVSQKKYLGIPYIEINTTDFSEEETKEALLEKLNVHLTQFLGS